MFLSEDSYKRLEKFFVVIMLLGIIAMFQPWFQQIVGLFEPMFPDARLERFYRTEIAPHILRYGFLAAFLGTIAFTVISHYTYESLQKATKAKGGILVVLLISMPVIFGFGVLDNLAWTNYYAALLAVFNFIFAIAMWHKRMWGAIALPISVLIGLGLALTGNGSLLFSTIFVIVTVAALALALPKRATILIVSE